jgi:hypothetical protein
MLRALKSPWRARTEVGEVRLDLLRVELEGWLALGHLGFGRIVVTEIEVPNLLANLL